MMTDNRDQPAFQASATPLPQMIWMPEKDRIHDSLLYQFMVELSEKKNTLFHDYNQLHHWSVEHSEEFWELVWDFCQVVGEKHQPVTFTPPHSPFPVKETRWFPGATLNFAENLLKNWNRRAAADAIIFHCEGDPQRRQEGHRPVLHRERQAEESRKHQQRQDTEICPRRIAVDHSPAQVGGQNACQRPGLADESKIPRFVADDFQPDRSRRVCVRAR